MRRQTKLTKRWRTITTFLILVATVAGVVTTLFMPKASAVRGGTYPSCQTEVSLVGFKPVPGSSNRMYATFEFRLEGNDYARRFIDGSGNVQTEPGSQISSSGTCGHDGLWNGVSFDYNSTNWRGVFDYMTNALLHTNYQSVANVYAGMGPNTDAPSPTNNYCSDPGVGINDPPTFFGSWRFIMGIEKCASNSVFGSVNDAGLVYLNGRVLWCMGMGYGYASGLWECKKEPQTGASIDAATVYTGGGDFAGFLNADTPPYYKARDTLNTYYSSRIINRQPINDLLSGSNIPLEIFAQNTRDPVPPSWGAACANVPPGVSPCFPPGLPADPLVNNKASTFMTFEIVGGPMLLGRVYVDNNGDGAWQAGEPFVQNGVDCTSAPTARVTVPGVYVTVSGIAGQYPPNKCNADPYYEAAVQTGVRSVGITVPAGWTVTSPNPVNVNFASPSGTYHQWFGIKPVTLICGAASTNVDAAEVGVPFDLSVSVAPHIAGSSGYVAIRTTNNPSAPLAPGTNVPDGVAPGAYDSDGKRTFSNVTISQAGTYYVRWTYNTPSGNSITCSQPLSVGTKPYLKVYGNDVKAGSAFNSTSSNCSLGSVYNPKASLLTLARNQTVGSSTQWYGAGSQLAAFALGEISGFTSGIMKSPSNASSTAAPPKGLTFGNYYDPSSTYGGQGGQYGCITDYYTVVSKAIGGSAAATQVVKNVSGFPRNLFIRPLSGYPAVLFSDTTTSIASGTRAAVVVDGDIYIPYNITYQPYTASTVPSLYVIVRGNIYIGAGVTNLSGVYIAQPKTDGTGGTIYTCSKDTGPYGINPAAHAASDLATSCNQQLTVNGAFIAKEVKFLRTAGTLNSSAQNETWSSTNIAEIFKSSPELYLSAPSVLQRSREGGQGGTTYDSIGSLPPIL